MLLVFRVLVFGGFSARGGIGRLQAAGGTGAQGRGGRVALRVLGFTSNLRPTTDYFKQKAGNLLAFRGGWSGASGSGGDYIIADINAWVCDNDITGLNGVTRAIRFFSDTAVFDAMIGGEINNGSRCNSNKECRLHGTEQWL